MAEHHISRAEFTFGTAAAAAALALPELAQAATAATHTAVAPWPIMRGNWQGTGDGTHLRFRKLVSGVRTLSTGKTINATPTLAHDDLLCVGSSDHNFYIFDPITKKSRAIDFGNIIDSAASITGNRAYVASGDHQIWHVDLRSGAHEQIFPGPDDAPTPTLSTIGWFEGNVVLGPDGSLYAGNDNFWFYNIDVRNDVRKRVKWKFTTGNYCWSAAAFSRDGKTLYFTSVDGHLYALAAASGRFRWSAAADDMCVATPAVAPNGTIYFASFDHNVYAYSPKGTRLWKYATTDLIYASPCISPDGATVYVLSSDGALYALSAATGALRWRAFLGQPSFSSPALGLDPQNATSYLIYVGSGNGSIAAYTPKGALRWRYDTLSRPGTTEVARAYPAINSSIALGNGGLATAVSNGDLVYVPYDEYQHNAPGFSNTDPFAGAGTAPQVFYCSAGGLMTEAALPAVSEALLRSQVFSLRAVANDGSGTGFVEIDPQSVALTANGKPVEHYVSGHRTQLFVVPSIDAAPQPRTYNLTAKSAQGAAIAVTFTQAARALPDAPSASELAHLPFVFTQFAFPAPFIVPALNEVGYASLSMPARVIDVRADGSAIGYGYLYFAAGGLNQPPRRYRYAFAGTYHDGELFLECKNCLFEVTSIPIPFDRFRFSGGMTTTGPSLGSSLYTEYTLPKDLPPVTPAMIVGLLMKLNGGRVPKEIAELQIERGKHIMQKLIDGSLFADWGMFDERRRAVSIGTFQTEATKRQSLAAGTLHYDKATATLRANVPYELAEGVVGLVLIDREQHVPVPLHYDLTPTFTINAHNTMVKLEIPAEYRKRPLDAWLMANLERIATLQIN